MAKRRKVIIPFTEVVVKILESTKYASNKSSINKKWARYLKNKKLFDDYMICLSYWDGAGANPKTYKQLSCLCHNINGVGNVDWYGEFKEFANKTIKWYNFKDRFLYAINEGYK